MELYDQTSFNIAERVTKNYSTSFYTASLLFRKEIRCAIFSIYGFVRIADEIVDTFHGFDKKTLLDKLERDYYEAHQSGISTNPILHAFQLTVKKYQIDDQHIQAFLNSMKMDLDKRNYATAAEIGHYIYGSAEVVGLMCLKVFCNGNQDQYNKLEQPAAKLGAAFQKVNFLRDLKQDIEELDRRYFPSIDKGSFNDATKQDIIKDIENDFSEALSGLRQLPSSSKLAVSVAYLYYRALLMKIKQTPSQRIVNQRIRIHNTEKTAIVFKALAYNALRLI
jgi:15-cis-phytoene synthase